MKKILLITLGALCLATPICAKKGYSASSIHEWNKPAHIPIKHVVPFNTISDDMISDVMKNGREDVAVECPAGTRIPLNLFIKGDLLSCEADQDLSIKVLKKFYVKSNGQEVFFSQDMTNWLPFFKFTTGEAFCQLKASSGKPTLTIGLEGNIR